jgi:hypothetical protein
MPRKALKVQGAAVQEEVLLDPQQSLAKIDEAKRSWSPKLGFNFA